MGRIAFIPVSSFFISPNSFCLTSFSFIKVCQCFHSLRFILLPFPI